MKITEAQENALMLLDEFDAALVSKGASKLWHIVYPDGEPIFGNVERGNTFHGSTTQGLRAAGYIDNRGRITRAGKFAARAL